MSSRLRNLRVLLLASPVLLAACGGSIPVVVPDPQRSMLAVKEPGGGLLWRTRFQTFVSANPPVVGDLEGDGSWELLVFTDTYDVRNGGYLFLFEEDGTLRWSLDFSDPLYDVPYQQYGPRGERGPGFQLLPAVKRAFGIDLLGDAAEEVVFLASTSCHFYPFLVGVLDRYGRVRGVFWNPGGADDIELVRDPTTGSRSIALLGKNNHFTKDEEKGPGFYRYAVFLLEGEALETRDRVSRRAPSTPEDELSPCCKWYCVLPPYDWFDEKLGDSLRIIERGATPEISVDTRAGFSFTFGLDGSILRIAILPSLKEELKRRGQDPEAYRAGLEARTIPFGNND